MQYRGRCFVWLLVAALVGLARPAAAQILEPKVSPFSFPVLAGEDFHIDPTGSTPGSLFRVAEGALLLRSSANGWVDMEAFCRVPERHWGPVSLISCSMEVSGRPTHTGLTLPSRIALSDLPIGSTITLRMLMQAPLIVLDLEGNPTAVLDTFVEEYHWTVDGGRHS
jgi:hypothetical protein